MPYSKQMGRKGVIPSCPSAFQGARDAKCAFNPPKTRLFARSKHPQFASIRCQILHMRGKRAPPSPPLSSPFLRLTGQKNARNRYPFNRLRASVSNVLKLRPLYCAAFLVHWSTQSFTVLYQSCEFCGFSTQCPSSGKYSIFDGTFFNCSAVKSWKPSLTSSR